MTSEQFKQSWGVDAIGTLNAVIRGLANADAEGEEVILMLDRLGISNIRTKDTMTRLVTAADSLTEYLDKSNDAWENFNALEEEANKRYGTVASQMKILKNTFDNLAIVLGDVMLPYIKEFVMSLQEMVMRFVNMDEWQKRAVLGLGMLAAAIAPVTGAISMFTGEKGISGLIKKLKEFAGEEGLGGKIAQWVSGLGNLSGGINLLTAGIAGLAAVLALSFLANEDVRTSLAETWNTIKEKLTPVIQGLFTWLQDLWSFCKQLLAPAIEAFIDLGTQIWGLLENIVLVIADVIAWLFGETGLGPLLSQLWEWLKGLADWLLGTLIGTVLTDLVNMLSTILGWVNSLIGKFRELINKKNEANNIPLNTSTVAASAKSFSAPTPIASGGFGLRPVPIASGGNTLSLTTNINVNNNGTPIDESVVRRWGNVITDIVSDNLGKRW